MINFNKPYLTGKELEYIAEAHSNGQLAGDGIFTRRCSNWLEKNTGSIKVLLTHSCTASLEMAAILADIGVGDEVIMPSYTFVSTANAFVMRGGVAVFVDIRADTLNIDENLIEAAITSRTKAIVVVHYAGVACEMDKIMSIARANNLIVIEDAAQGIMSTYKGRPLGSIGDLGCYSFHETKNIISGEGGALLINNMNYIKRAEIIREKGTNRSRFFRGEIDKYTWVDIGSSYLPGELIAAFLYAQLQGALEITNKRLDIWNNYYLLFSNLKDNKNFSLPIIPENMHHNGHMFYLLLTSAVERGNFLKFMKENGINCVFHYVPLHSSPCGLKNARSSGKLLVTEDVSSRLVRMPLWIGLNFKLVSDVVESYFKQ